MLTGILFLSSWDLPRVFCLALMWPPIYYPPHIWQRSSNTKNEVIFSTSYDKYLSWTTTNCALGPTSFTIEFDFLELSVEDQNLALMFFRYYSLFVGLWMVFCSELSRLWEYYVPGQRLLRLQHIPKMFSFPLLVSLCFFFHSMFLVC